jgi:hypothetical protein
MKNADGENTGGAMGLHLPRWLSSVRCTPKFLNQPRSDAAKKKDFDPYTYSREPLEVTLQEKMLPFHGLILHNALCFHNAMALTGEREKAREREVEHNTTHTEREVGYDENDGNVTPSRSTKA